MKRLLSLTLCLILCISSLCCVNIYAADETTDETVTIVSSFDGTKGELVVSGSVTSAKGNIPMTLIVFNSEDMVYDAVNTISEKAENGIATYKFDAIPFVKTTPTDIYKVVVSCDFIFKSASVSFKFSGIDIKREALEAMDGADTTSDAIDVLDDYYDVFGFGEEYDLYNYDQKKLIVTMVKKMDYNVPDDEDPLTDEEVNAVFEQAVAANVLSAEGKAMAEVVNCTDLDAWVDNYAKKYDFDKDNEETDYDEAVLADYFMEAIKISGFNNFIKDCHKGVENFDELAENFYEHAILYLSGKLNFTKSQDILENKDIKEFIPIDRSNFKSLNSSKKKNLYKFLAGENNSDIPYESMENFVDAIDDKVDDLKKDSSYSGGDTSYIGDSSDKSRPGVVSTQPEQTIVTIFPFTDLVGFDWATESIQKLYYLGIVKGVSETEFAPNGKVTRAEFAKMLVGALGLTLDSYEGIFTDVSADSWYASYVQTAYNNGIVMGDGSTFNPNGYITREDISVMIYRALELGATDEVSNILDKAYISGYAVDAILTLYDMGIMTGDGTGNVYPKDNATRAEAAKLVYNAFVK